MDDYIFNLLPSAVIMTIESCCQTTSLFLYRCDTCGILSRKGGQFTSHFAFCDAIPLSANTAGK